MISIRKSIEMEVEGLLESTLDSYRAALVAMGNAGVQACPPAGESLQQSLLHLHAQLTAGSTRSVVTETEERLEAELQAWGDRAAGYYRDRTNDVKEILTVVAKAADDVGERDERYRKRFRDLTVRLQASASLPDLASIRQSLNRNATDLAKCVANMGEDTQESVKKLRAQLVAYEARLEEVELLASVDTLTGLANRRKVERQLELRMKDGQRFSIIYLDLNEFKRINDIHGHLAGDDLLHQVAHELRCVFRTTDLVGRWGGDEFIVLVDGDLAEAQLRVLRIEKWVNGEYTVTVGSEQRTVTVSVAAGVAEWRPGTSLTDLLSCADRAMYENKSQLAGSKRTAS